MINDEAWHDYEEQLWNFLKHGEPKHQKWLRVAITAFFKGEDKPPPLE